jgi:hypothetical protein
VRSVENAVVGRHGLGGGCRRREHESCTPVADGLILNRHTQATVKEGRGNVVM